MRRRGIRSVIAGACLIATGAGADEWVEASFESGTEGFVFVRDAFMGTRAPDHASGAWWPGTAGRDGALEIVLGNHDAETVHGMSGAWTRTFELERPVHDLRIRLRFEMTQAAGYESDELSQVMVALDGVLLPGRGIDYVERLSGDGNGGPPRSTGWRRFSSREGTLAPGAHTLEIGGFNDKKTMLDEWTRIRIDDVVVSGWSEPPCRLDADCDDGNPCTDDTCAAGVCRHRGNTSRCADGFDYSEEWGSEDRSE